MTRWLIVVLAGFLAQQTFRTAVDTVELDVAVMQGNKAVPGLVGADFEVIDNNVKQTILEVSRERQPIDVVLVVDVSGSVRGALLTALTEAVNNVQRRLRDGDRAELITFNHQVLGRMPLTPARASKTVRLDGATGSTSLNDALVVSMAAPAEIGRRRMAIVFTDGYDTSSFLEEKTVLDVAARSHTAIFVVSTDSKATDFFSRLADTTGGVVQIVPPVGITISTIGPNALPGNSVMTFGPSGDVLDASFFRAFDDFRTSYVVRYSLTGVTRQGWHDVSVRVLKSGRYQVRAKKGYIF
jgi:VWFA-related protein